MIVPETGEGEIDFEGTFAIQFVRGQSFDYRFVPSTKGPVAIRWRFRQRAESTGMDLPVELSRAVMANVWPRRAGHIRRSASRVDGEESVIDIALEHGPQFVVRERDACLLRVCVPVGPPRAAAGASVNASKLGIVTYAPELS